MANWKTRCAAVFHREPAAWGRNIGVHSYEFLVIRTTRELIPAESSAAPDVVEMSRLDVTTPMNRFGKKAAIPGEVELTLAERSYTAA